jgi:glycosyltransferase involved in cell wall biosynthesis
MIGVSCICPTFGRTNLLPEAVESFLRQDYAGPIELVIVNDLPEQEIVCEAKDVRVINSKKRFSSLGDKRTFSYQQAKYPLIITWGDDDIHLQNRVSRAVTGLGEGDMALEGWHFCLYGKEMKYNKFSTSGAHIVKAELAEKVGWFSPKNTGEDEDFNAKVHRATGKTPSIREFPAFIYRWSGTERAHISAFHSPNGKIDAYQVIGDKAKALLQSGQEPTGTVVIRPQWRADYRDMVSHHAQ